MRFCLRTLVNGAWPRRLALTLLTCAVLELCLTTPALAQRGRRGTPAAKPGASQPSEAPRAANMSKAQAIISLIEALRINRSEAACQTLDQIVRGNIQFGKHSQQAAQLALAALAMRPTPDGSAALQKLVSEPDDKLRPDDKVYTAAAVRYDAVRVAGRVGSPELRVALVKLYDQATPEIRRAIEGAISRPSPANFAAQVILLRSRELPEAIKTALRQQIFEQNATALKQALKLTVEGPAKGASTGGPANSLAEFGKLAGLTPSTGSTAKAPTGGAPAAPSVGLTKMGGGYGGPAAPAGSATGNGNFNPAAAILDSAEKMLDSTPIDTALVARELWQNDFVEALSADLATDKGNPQQVLNGIGSIPLKTARERMHDYLQQKTPQDLGRVEKPAVAMPSAPTGGPAAGRPAAGGFAGFGGMGMGRGGAGHGAQRPASKVGAATQGPVYAIGADWLDPGTVVVLKTLSYKDRPKPKHRTTSPSFGGSGKRSPAAEKRAEEAAEKAKVLEASYEWRDAIEKFVSHWDDRLGAVAEKSESAETDAAAAKAESGTNEKGAGKDTKGSDALKSKLDAGKAAKESVREAKSSETKSKGSGAPTTTVKVPFALRSGEHITKEFHLRWPDDLPANLTAAASEPLVVHYVQLEGTDEISRTATFYNGALARTAGAKIRSTTHDTPEGKWVDILQHDIAGHRTRSFDVLVTHQEPEPDAKKSKVEDLTIQVLFIEVESFEPEAKPAEKADKTEKKEQARRDSP
jgi:hypothetical protein